MIWQMDISQGSVLVSVFCLTRCNYKQCCLFAHLASGYHVRPGLVITPCHTMSHAASHLTRGRESLKWNSVWHENMIPTNNGRNLAAWGLSPSDPLVANMTIRDTDIPSHADINQSNGPKLSVRNHIPILIHAPSRPITSWYKMCHGLGRMWSKSFLKSYLGRWEVEMFLEKNLLS